MCPTSIRPLLWNRWIIPIPFYTSIPNIQLDWWKPVLYQRQQWKPEHRSRRWKVWSVVGRRFVLGKIGTLRDIRQRSVNTQRRFHSQNFRMLGFHIKKAQRNVIGLVNFFVSRFLLIWFFFMESICGKVIWWC